MNTFDYDELKNTRLSKTVLNPYLDRSRHLTRRPFRVVKLNVFKNSKNHQKDSVHLSNSSCDHLKSNSRSTSLVFDELTSYLRIKYSKRRPRVRRKNRSTQTKQDNEPILHENNTVLELPSDRRSKVYVNLANGFSSYKREDVIEDKKMVLKFRGGSFLFTS